MKIKKKVSITQNSFLNKPKENFVSINFGSYYLKGLVVKKEKVIDHFIIKNEDLSNGINKLWAAKKIPAKKVKLSIKSPSCLVRYFPFPKMDKGKLKQALFYEMSKFIPFSPDEVYYDFFILKEISPSEILILLAVVKKDFLDPILEIFKEAKLKIDEINLDSICLTNLFLNNYNDSDRINACILDIGYSFTTMTILNKGVPFLTRDVNFNTKDVLQIISRIKNLSLSEVEKWLSTLEDNSEFLELTRDSISNLCKEIKNSFDYFEVNKGEPIDRLYLSGGLISTKNIEQIFTNYVGIEASVLKVADNLHKNINKFPSEKEAASFKNKFAAAFGLIA